MHNAPSVSYPVGRCAFAARLLLGTWLAGLLVLMLWLLQAPWSWRQSAGIAAWACAGLLAWRGWSGSPEGVLAWDGASWRWEQGATASELTLRPVLDLQRYLLIETCTAQRCGWVWLEQRRLPGRWPALRRAVYSRAKPQALPLPDRPAAKP